MLFEDQCITSATRGGSYSFSVADQGSELRERSSGLPRFYPESCCVFLWLSIVFVGGRIVIVNPPVRSTLADCFLCTTGYGAQGPSLGSSLALCCLMWLSVCWAVKLASLPLCICMLAPSLLASSHTGQNVLCRQPSQWPGH